MKEADKVQVLQLAARLYAATQKKKNNDAKFSEFKKSIEEQLDAFISTGESVIVDGALTQNEKCEIGVYTVTNIAPSTITWYADKLKAKLDKAIYKRIVKKSYTIKDFEGLVKYLKSCGVNPNEFKKYIEVKEIVDVKALDNMSKLGYIAAERIAGCYSVELKKPYYKVSFRKQS